MFDVLNIVLCFISVFLMGCPIPTYYQIALGGMTVFNLKKKIL